MELDQFFSEIAEALTVGDLETAAASLATPAVIHVGRRTITVPDRQAVIDTLERYRANLLVESYAKTTCTIQHVSHASEGRPQAFVTWCNLNDAGAEISRFDAAYIVCRDDAGHLQCLTSEVMEPIKERLVGGLAMV